MELEGGLEDAQYMKSSTVIYWWLMSPYFFLYISPEHQFYRDITTRMSQKCYKFKLSTLNLLIFCSKLSSPHVLPKAQSVMSKIWQLSYTPTSPLSPMPNLWELLTDTSGYFPSFHTRCFPWFRPPPSHLGHTISTLWTGLPTSRPHSSSYPHYRQNEPF